MCVDVVLRQTSFIILNAYIEMYPLKCEMHINAY